MALNGVCDTLSECGFEKKSLDWYRGIHISYFSITFLDVSRRVFETWRYRYTMYGSKDVLCVTGKWTGAAR